MPDLSAAGGRNRQDRVGPGIWVVVGGPDGTGKTTLVDRLTADSDRPVLHLHHRPRVLAPRTGSGDPVTDPHRETPYPPVLSLGKLVFVHLDYLVGWWMRIRPWLRDGGDVILERGWWDLAVDPRRYRLHAAPRLVRLLGRVLPRPAVTFVLGGDAATIAARKSELSVEETQRQLREWDAVPQAAARPEALDVTLRPEQVAAAARDAVAAARHRQRWIRLPLRGTPRWFLPASPRGATAAALRLHDPVTPRGRRAHLIGGSLARTGGLAVLGRHANAPPPQVLAPLLGHVHERERLAVAAGNHRGRYTAMVLEPDGTHRAFAKIGTDEGGRTALESEVAAAGWAVPLLPDGLHAPEVLAHEPGLVLFEHVVTRTRARPWELPPEVAYLLGRFHAAGSTGAVGPAHGDCAPWNLLWTARGWCLVDWAEARPDAPPFEDVLHFVVQAHSLLGRPGRDEVVAAIGGRGPSAEVFRRYAHGADVDPASLSVIASEYLERTAVTFDRTTPDGRVGRHARAALLDRLAQEPS